MRGIFITIEGPDGAGKTSVIKKLIPMLVETIQQEIVATREPGGSRIAEEIRELGVFSIYELLPAFLTSLLVCVVVSLVTPAPSKEIEAEFEAAK